MAPVPVQIRLGQNHDTGEVDRSAPMMVWGEGDERHPAMCAPEQAVLDQLTESETGGRFLGEWDGESWCIGKRIQDA